jgi:hypothetical protein
MKLNNKNIFIAIFFMLLGSNCFSFDNFDNKTISIDESFIFDTNKSRIEIVSEALKITNDYELALKKSDNKYIYCNLKKIKKEKVNVYIKVICKEGEFLNKEIFDKKKDEGQDEMENKENKDDGFVDFMIEENKNIK